MSISRTLSRAWRAALVLLVALSAACNAPNGSPTPREAPTLAGATFTPAADLATQPPSPAATLPPARTPAPDEATATVPAPTAQPTTASSASVTADDLVNVRSGPGTAYSVLGQLTAGQTVAATGRDDASTWWQIAFAGGPDGKGWVFGELVTANAAAASLPVVAPPPLPTAGPATNTPVPATQPPPPTSVSNQYAAPTLLSPADDTTFTGENITITLSWQSVGPLAPGECYQVQVIHRDGTYRTPDDPCITGTSWNVQAWLFEHRPDDRTLLWSVRVYRPADGVQLSPWSATWAFVWYGG